MKFEDKPEAQHSRRMEPVLDRIYRKFWGSNIKIRRAKLGGSFDALDADWRIDATIYLADGTVHTLQEHALKKRYHHYRTFTSMWHRNRFTGSAGEFFTIKAEYWSHGYADQECADFDEWYLFNRPALQAWLRAHGQKWLKAHVRPVHEASKASFLQVPYDYIPDEFKLYSWKHPIGQLSTPLPQFSQPMTAGGMP